MILGYEQPVDIPVMSIYDKQAIRDYVGAVLKDYLDARAAEDAFYEKYGKFYSPVIGANDAYYDATIGKVQKVYDDMVKRGIDPIRTPEGRAMIRLAIRSVDIPYSNSIKANSEGIETYLKNQAQLIANGQYDDNLNKWFLNKRGLDPYNFDFRHQTWDVMSPLKKTTINEQLAPTIQDLAKNGYDLDKELTRQNPGYRVSTVTPQRMLDALNTNVDDLMKDPRMQYFKETSGLNDEQFKQVLLKHMAAELQPKYETDQVYLTNLKIRHDDANLAADRALKWRMHKDQQQHEDEQSRSIQYTDVVGFNTNEALTQPNPGLFLNLMKNKAKVAKTEKERNMYLGYEKEWANYPKMSKSQQALFLQKYGYITPEAAQFMSKYGYIPEGGATDKWYQWNKDAHGALRGKKKASRYETLQNSNKYIELITTPQTSNDRDIILKHMSGGQKVGKYYNITFGNGIEYAPATALNQAGVTPDQFIAGKNKDGHFKFNDYLNNSSIQGIAYRTNNLRAGRTLNGDFLTTNIGTSVPESTLDDFFNAARKNGYYIGKSKITKTTSNQNIARALGLSYVKKDGTPVKTSEITKGTYENGEFKPESTTKSRTEKNDASYYYIIPTSMITPGQSYNLYGLNDEYNKYIGGVTYSSSQRNAALTSAHNFSAKAK